MDDLNATSRRRSIWTSGRTAPIDEALIRSLYAEHGVPLFRRAYRLTGDRQLAEDVVQETLIRAWQNADALSDDRGSVRGWLFIVTRNVAIDMARARAARLTEVSGEAADIRMTTAAVGDHADGVADTVLVRDALAGLTPEHRDALVEVYFRGKTAREASLSLGVPVGTVKSRVYHALRALRVRLGETTEVSA